MRGMLRLMATVSCIIVLGAWTAKAATNYFLVAEWPGHVFHNDSYVITLTNTQHIAHARDLIARGPQTAGTAIVVANLVAGEDGINRDLRRNGVPWCWHVSSVTGFADFTAEILDGWPSQRGTNYPCANPDATNSLGAIGFWSYTVVAELPLRPQILGIQRQGTQTRLTITNLTPPFLAVVETATNLANPNWQSATNFQPDRMAFTVSVPTTSRAAFYRVRVQ